MSDLIEKRLTGLVAEGLQRGGVLIGLFHCTDGGDALIKEYQIDRTKDEASPIAIEILREASEHVECFSLPQRFAAQCYLRDKSPCGHRQFLLRPLGTARGPIGSVTEPPNERGLFAQLMRHSEAAYSTNVELTRAIATMHQARAETAETAFHRHLAERERWATHNPEEQRRAQELKQREDEAAREHEMIVAGMEDIRPVIRNLAPQVARKLGSLIDPGKKSPAPSAPSAPSAPGPNASGSGSSPTATAAAPDDGTAPPAREKQERAPAADDRREARRAHLQTVLDEITEEDAAKFEEVLGPEKTAQLASAIVTLLRRR